MCFFFGGIFSHLIIWSDQTIFQYTSLSHDCFIAQHAIFHHHTATKKRNIVQLISLSIVCFYDQFDRKVEHFINFIWNTNRIVPLFDENVMHEHAVWNTSLHIDDGIWSDATIFQWCFFSDSGIIGNSTICHLCWTNIALRWHQLWRIYWE